MKRVRNAARLAGWGSALLAVLVVSAGCGDDDSAPPPTTATAGTSVVFDLDADLTNAAHFYDLPYPSDLRLDDNGYPDVRGFPLAPGNTVLPSTKAIAARSAGFPTIPAAYFRFDAPLAARDPNTVIPAEPTAPLLLLDVDPGSPDRGHLVPVVATVVPTDSYAPANLLAVAPMPGMVLAPRHTYAFVVQRAFGDGSGTPLGVPLPIAQLRDGHAPRGVHGAAALASYAPLWRTLDDIGVDRAHVAAATVFTTGDVVGDLAALSSAVLANHEVTIDALALDPATGAAHPRFCALHGRVRFPQFQRGKPPFNTQGLFDFDADGLLTVQREEDVPVVVTIPRSAMPSGGYPLVVYAHGSAGLSTQVVDRGPVTMPGGEPTPGEGPAHVLAAHGFAMAASAMPLNPERLPGAELRAYLNIRNLASYPDTFRQGTIEQRLFIDALARLRIAADLLAGCDGPALPAGETSFRIRTEPVLAMGQSMGAQYATMLAAVEPRVAAVVPTGSGGLWSLVILEAEIFEGVDSRELIGRLMATSAHLTPLHPGLQLMQQAFAPADPIVYAPRIARDPLPGHPTRSIYQPIGLDDPGFPNAIYTAMAVAYGTQQAGAVLWPGLPPALAAGGRGGLAPYPVAGNLTSRCGTPYTGVVAQYAGDGILESHHIFAQLDAVKHQYGCFLATASATGTAVVPPPLALGTPCPTGR